MRSLVLVVLLPAVASAQGFSPADAVKRMALPPGFSVTCVAAEPLIRQPLSISFDERGRLWVLQYLQYPNPAGLKPVRQDQYLRTVWDRVPEPPPRGPKGLDRLTILSEPDANGVFTKSKDFVTGLNLASGFCVGRGGVYVVQPPYLLFYPDATADDVPDGDPQVLLSGFGLEDTHSLANSLQWGPDGWLYGAAGSTSTCKILNPAFPAEPAVEFQQGVWRFHPKSKRFELFAEGGGNTYGLDFDRAGRCLAGTNFGGQALLHHLPGTYYVKGFNKHGPLHNSHAYGYFDHVPYTGFKGGHVTCGGTVYDADAYPASFRGTYVAANLLSNAVHWHTLTPKGASLTAAHGGELLVGNDTWFRPVDLTLGPDGCVYVADWYDRRAAHLDPIDNWDKTNGRVYRIDYAGVKRPPAFDLRTKSAAGLVELLTHPNVWWRREARRQIAERAAKKDAGAFAALREAANRPGPLALESLWAQASAGWVNPFYPVALLKHPDEPVRAWAVRLAADDPSNYDPDVTRHLADLAAREPSAVVHAELACVAKRLPADDAVRIVRGLLANPAATDPHLHHLVWWAVESRFADRPAPAGVLAKEVGEHASPLFEPLVEKVARRLVSADVDNGELIAAVLLNDWARAGRPAPVLRGLAAAFDGGRREKVSDELRVSVERVWAKSPADDTARTLLARFGHRQAVEAVWAVAANGKKPVGERVKAAELLRQIRDPDAKPVFVAMLADRADAARLAAVGGLEAFDDPATSDVLLKAYPSASAAVKRRIVQALTARKAWAAALLSAVESKALPAADVPEDRLRAVVAFADPALTARIEKLYGRVGPITPGEKQARISWLTTQVGRLKGDATAGKPLFTQHCATCHKLFDAGQAVGPDLTTTDRKNVGYMLAQVVDPSAYVRPEYVQHEIATTDGRKLSGLVVAASDQAVTLLDAQNRRTTVARADIEELKPMAASLMPEKLLDTLTDQQVADLFAYLRSEPKK